MSLSRTENSLQYVEKMFVRYGAVPVDAGNAEQQEHFGLRRSFVRDGIYYRAEAAAFNGAEVILITATDNPAYDRLGLQDNITGFQADLPEERLEREVRFVFGIEPWPDTYPDY